MLLVNLEKKRFFFLVPVALLQLWIENVEPTLADLLSTATHDRLSGLRPLGCAFLANPVAQQVVFLFGPGSLDETWLEYLSPTVKALDGGSPPDDIGDLAPVFGSGPLNCSLKALIFFECPFSATFGGVRPTFKARKGSVAGLG